MTTLTSEVVPELSREFIDVAQAAAKLGLTVSYLHNLRHYGRGPESHKIGRRIYYRLADLKTWDKERSRKAAVRKKRAELRRTIQSLSA